MTASIRAIPAQREKMFRWSKWDAFSSMFSFSNIFHLLMNAIKTLGKLMTESHWAGLTAWWYSIKFQWKLSLTNSWWNISSHLISIHCIYVQDAIDEIELGDFQKWDNFLIISGKYIVYSYRFNYKWIICWNETCIGIWLHALQSLYG